MPEREKEPVPLLLRDAGTDLATLQVLGVALGFAVGVLSSGVRVRGSAALGVLINLATLERFLALPWLSARLGCRCHTTALPPHVRRQTAAPIRADLRFEG
jgi:hypothetical protein